MFIYIGKLINKILTVMLVVLIVVSIILIINILTLKSNLTEKSDITIGANIHTQKEIDADKEITKSHIEEVDNKNNSNGEKVDDNGSMYALDERFQRPSKLAAVKLKYNFRPKDEEEVPPYIPEGFPSIYQSPENVINAYYAILKNAANIIGYDGGCGTIAWMDTPYPYAYRLLSDGMKGDITLEEFKDSFKGTGAMNLLHLEPAYQPSNTPDNIKYYFVEVELLKGHLYKKEGKTFKRQPNYFEYYYGIITTEYDEKQGWRIKSIDYLPEVYLCHPFHGWDYYYDAIIGVIYNNWYGMNLKINSTEIEKNYIQVYASNQDNKYKFDFIRLTNGDDVLLHEYIKENNEWKEVSILKPDDEKYYKISILKFNDQL